jgi:microcin C transport system permease protein
VFRDYPETTFGGDLPTNAVYTDREVQKLIDGKGWMLWPLIPYRYDTIIPAKGATRCCRPRSSIRWAPTTRRATSPRG